MSVIVEVWDNDQQKNVEIELTDEGAYNAAMSFLTALEEFSGDMPFCMDEAMGYDSSQEYETDLAAIYAILERFLEDSGGEEDG